MALGLDPDDFWTKTPRYLSMIFEGKSRQLRREHNERAWLAHTIASLPRYKKLPDLKTLLARDTPARKAQSPDQQWAIFAAMAEASKVVRKN